MLLGTHDFKELTQNDQRLDDEIHKRTKEVDSLQTTIQQWRAKIRTLKTYINDTHYPHEA